MSEDWESTNDYATGHVRVAWAAGVMGITFDQLRQACRERGVSSYGGVSWDELIPITRDLYVRHGTPQLARALKTFILTSKEDRAA